MPASLQTVALAINDAGQIAGFYRDGASATHGFVDDNGLFTTIDFPGAFSTQVTGINNRGEIVGVYNSPTTTQSFLGSAIPEPALLALLACGSFTTGVMILLQKETSK